MRIKLARILPSAIFGLVLSCAAYGQSSNVPRTSADENFQLNITESRVTEINYERSTSVALFSDTNGSGINLRVGATATGAKIEITLLNVTGNVRFRASLDAIRKRIEQMNQSNPK